MDLRFLTAWKPEPLGTGGAIAKAMTMVESQSVLVLNGDSFIKINLEEIERKIPTSKKSLTSCFERNE